MNIAYNKISTSIRYMVRRDMREVLAIESDGFEFPWTGSDFLRCLRRRGCWSMIAERDGHTVGFVVYELHKTRIEILNLAVDGPYRLTGVGTKMLDRIGRKLRRRKTISATVSDRNLDACLFFRARGFVATDVIHEPYEQCRDDAYRFIFRAEWRDD